MIGVIVNNLNEFISLGTVAIVFGFSGFKIGQRFPKRA